MLKNRYFKTVICTIITWLMILTNINTGVLGAKQVFAKTSKIESRGDKEVHIPKKLKIVLSKKEGVGNSFYEVKVVDELCNPVKDAEIVSSYVNEECLLNNLYQRIVGKTDNNGKALINIFSSDREYNMYFMAKIGNIKSDIKHIKILKSKYNVCIKIEEEFANNKTLIGVGQNLKFDAYINDKVQNSNIIWESDDTNIATVDKFGNVKGVKEGKTVIRVKLKEYPDSLHEIIVKVYNDLIKVHVRNEFKQTTSFSDYIQIPGKERSLEDVLKNFSNPKFSEDGKLMYDDNTCYLVIINGKIEENPKSAKIKNGDDIVIYHGDGETDMLNIESPNSCICIKPFEVKVTDNQGKPIKGATVFVSGYTGTFIDSSRYKLGVTDDNGKANINLNQIKKLEIFAEKEGYIRSYKKPIRVVEPKLEVSFPKQVNAGEDFDIIITTEGKPVKGQGVFWRFNDSDNKAELGKTDDNGKVKVNIDAPTGKYYLYVSYYKQKNSYAPNYVKLGEINVLDKGIYKCLKVASIDPKIDYSTGVNLEGKIYLFDENEKTQSNICFNTKTNKVKNIGKVVDDSIQNSSVVDNKIYLFGEENIYEYNVEKNKAIEVAKVPKGYKIEGKGCPTINKKIYIYTKKDRKGVLFEFDPNTKMLNLVSEINLRSIFRITDKAVIAKANNNIYIIGGYNNKKIYEINVKNKQINTILKVDFDIVDKHSVTINNKIYILGMEIDKNISSMINKGSYHILEFNPKEKTFKNVGRLPKPVTNSPIVLGKDALYVFGGKYKLFYLERVIYGDITKITGFQLKDTQKPDIKVEGINDNCVVSTKEIQINVNVIDNKDEGIIPIVKCNGQEVKGIKEKYNLNLKYGENIIEITATDEAGNVQFKKYKVNCNNMTPSKIVINGTKERLHPKDKITLKASVLDKENNAILGKEVIFKSNNQSIATINEKTGEVTAVGNGTVVLTALLKGHEEIKESVKINVTDKYEVYMRIEAYDHTVMPRTKIEVGLEDLPKLGKATKFKRPTHAHALIKTLLNKGFEIGNTCKGKFNFNCPFYLQHVDGDGEFDHGRMSGWMYRVNGKLPNVGAQSKYLEDGDDIIWFYGAFGFDTAFTEMSVDKTKVSKGEPVIVNAAGYTTHISTYAINKISLENATVVINKILDGKEEPYNKLGEIKINKEGKAIFKFNEEGKYKLSIIRYAEGDGVAKGTKQIDIVRPIPVVITVGPNGVEESKDCVIENLTKTKEFKLGSDAKVTVKAINKTEENKDVALIVAVFTEKGKLINLGAAEQMIKGEDSTRLDVNLRLPNEGRYTVKAFVWDSIEGMKPMSKVIEIPVK